MQPDQVMTMPGSGSISWQGIGDVMEEIMSWDYVANTFMWVLGAATVALTLKLVIWAVTR